MEWAEEARNLLRRCTKAMNEKLAADGKFNIMGWEERFCDAYRDALNFEYRLRQAEADTIFEFVRERPIEYAGTITCPYCGKPATQLSHGQTLVGGNPDPNHHWRRSECKACGRLFTQEHKDGYVWYTANDDEQYVLCGLPTCYESYKLTCSKCSGTVVREYRQWTASRPWRCMMGCSSSLTDQMAPPNDRSLFAMVVVDKWSTNLNAGADLDL